ncbi:MAG: hypothetical protein JO281_11850 [Pseudonocardiales bacterium]|nr:hypothetical protein [Pseudonocardiales bacterium]
MPRWLHQGGQVIGWDLTWLPLCMDHQQTFVALRAHLVRALNPWGGNEEHQDDGGLVGLAHHRAQRHPPGLTRDAGHVPGS